MSFTFTKLFSGITESTVWVEPYATRVLWVSMLSWADKRGRVFGSVPGIARRAGINVDEAEAALASFLSPDRHSRTKDNDGRRIEPIDGGWRLLNYAKYRELRDHEDRLDYQREWDRKHRPERYKNPTLPTNPTKARPAPTKAEAEAELKPLAPNDSPNRSAQKVTWGESGFQIPDPVLAGFKTAYPAVAVEKEVAKAHAWALANPKHRKSQWGRFLNSWLQRAQDKARPGSDGEKRFVI